MSATEFCFRACKPSSTNSTKYCAHRYDVMGCAWNMPANYGQGVFESCVGDSGEPMGIYTTVVKVTSKSTSKSTSRSTSRGGGKTKVVTKVVTKTITKVSNKSTLMTWHQGQKPTPSAHPKPKSSSCKTIPTIYPANVSASASSSAAALPKRTAAPGPARIEAF